MKIAIVRVEARGREGSYSISKLAICVTVKCVMKYTHIIHKYQRLEFCAKFPILHFYSFLFGLDSIFFNVTFMYVIWYVFGFSRSIRSPEIHSRVLFFCGGFVFALPRIRVRQR